MVNEGAWYDHFGRLIRECCTERYIGGHVNNREFICRYGEAENQAMKSSLRRFVKGSERPRVRKAGVGGS